MEQSERPVFFREILLRFAEFKGVKVDEERLEQIMPRVEQYLENINRLEEVDVSAAEPAAIFLMEQE